MYVYNPGGLLLTNIVLLNKYYKIKLICPGVSFWDPNDFLELSLLEQYVFIGHKMSFKGLLEIFLRQL